MEKELNKIIIQKAANFQDILAARTEIERKLFHYNTVLTLCSRIILYNDAKAITLKNKLIDFFDEIEALHFKIKSKTHSLNLHKHLLPIVQYLIKKEHYTSSADLHLLTIIGAISDLIIFYFSDRHFPIFIVLFFILGVYRRIKAKREGKYAAMFW